MSKVKRILKIVALSIVVAVVLVVVNFFVIKKMDNSALESKEFYTSDYNTSMPTLLPSKFINGERFYIKMTDAKGDTLLGLGDSGGGISMMPEAVVAKRGLTDKLKNALLKGVMPCSYIQFRDVVPDPTIPATVGYGNMLLRTPYNVAKSILFVPRDDDEVKLIMETIPFDLFLGQNFFMCKAWTFDYPHQQIWVNTPLTSSDTSIHGVQKLGFKKNSQHVSMFGHPSMVIEVDGELIDVLFDTGASLILTEEGKKVLNTSENSIAGSFIAASVFDKWKKAHSDWKIYPKADAGQDVIEVPIVKVGGLEVGPVIFSKRPDKVWSEGMIASMDKVVKGALGGSALKYFKVTIDYNSDLIRFER